MGVRGGGTCARLLGLGLVSLQVQCRQQKAATSQGNDKGTAQEALLKAEEALQVGVGVPGPQGTGDLQGREAGSAKPARPTFGPHCVQFPPKPHPSSHASSTTAAQPPTRPYKSNKVGAAGIAQDVANCDLKRLCCPPASGHHH